MSRQTFGPFPCRYVSRGRWAAAATAGLLAALLVATGAGPAVAGTAREKQLEQRVERLEQELRSLKALIRGRTPRAGAEASGAMGELRRTVEGNRKAIEKIEKGGVKVSTKGGLSIKSGDGRFSARLGGRILVDGAIHDEDKSRLGDGAKVRQARLFVQGTLYRDWGYKSQFDFAKNAVTVNDLYLKYKGLKPAQVTVGNFKEPFGLSQKTSRKYLTFMERAVADVFAPGRHVGIAADAHGSNWSAAAGVFGASIGGASGEGDDGWDVSARATFAPIYEKTRSVHLGLAVRRRSPQDESMRFRIRPESNVTNARFLDTGTLANVDSTVIVQPEIAAVYGPFSVQGEYVKSWIARSAGQDDLAFEGWYAQASYFLTGESRNYRPAKGGFGRVKPLRSLFEGGPGAWEIGVRYGWLDLSDGTVRAGRERNLTLGLNWYVNPHVRFMFNYVRVDNDNDALGNAANLIPGKAFAGDDDPDIFQFRAQLDF